MRERTNEQWLADLRGPNPDEALADLYDLLVRGLAPLRHRLAEEDIIDGAGFPESLDTSSPLRLLDFRGWQFFDSSEVDSMLGAVRKALEQEKEILYEDEWRELAADWKTKNYDFALYWWVI